MARQRDIWGPLVVVDAPTQRAVSVRDDTPTYDAEALTGTDGLARIVLGSQTYTLRITRSGKLILTK
ncbi:MAG: hemin uptake protein HemP [Pseudomonadota bacterium]